MRNPFVSKKKHERIIEQAIGQEKKIKELETKLSALEDVSGIYKRRLKRIDESFEYASSGYLFSGGTDTDGYSETTKNFYDLNYSDFNELQKQCVEIFKINPYAKRIIEMMTDFTIGDGITYSIDDEFEEKLEPVLERFWHDYDNNFEENLESMCNELFVFGEGFYPVATGTASRVVNIGHVDPRMVLSVEKSEIRQKRLSKIVVKSYDNPDSISSDKISYFTVLGDIDGKLQSTDKQRNDSREGYVWMGDAFVFQINRLPSETRGYSELMTMLDTLDLLDQFVFQVSERSLLMYHFIMDITLKNADEQDVLAYRPPNPKVSSYHIHNDKVEAQLLTPDLKAVDAEALVRTVTRFALAGVGIPEHWIVAGDNTNYATAKEQNTPIEKRLENRQRFVKSMLKKIIRYQYEQHFTNASPAEIKDMLNATHINMPSVSGVDRKYRAEVLKMTGEALMMATSQGWIDAQSAGEEFVKLANKYGMELRVEEIDEDGIDGDEDQVETPDDILDELKKMRDDKKKKVAPSRRMADDEEDEVDTKALEI